MSKYAQKQMFKWAYCGASIFNDAHGKGQLFVPIPESSTNRRRVVCI